LKLSASGCSSICRGLRTSLFMNWFNAA
jgi:hypothetical protein